MSCTFWEREDIILLFIELIRRQLIYRPLGGCFFFPCKNRPKLPIRGKAQKIKIALLLLSGRPK